MMSSSTRSLEPISIEDAVAALATSPVASPTSPSKRHSTASTFNEPLSSRTSTSIESLTGNRNEDGSSGRTKSTSLSFATFPTQSVEEKDSHHSPIKTTNSRDIGHSRNQSASATFLTALAAHERYVLELKEELQRAEKDLSQLKSQWATYEAAKKRNEGRRGHQMRPLSTSSAKPQLKDAVDGSSAWMYEEMERRKALLERSQTSKRRVFSGSRHTRALSLLSTPTPPNAAQQSAPEQPSLARSGTAPDLGDYAARPGGHARSQSFWKRRSQSPERDVFKAGKQVATDIRDGLFTLIEDLRQATVGDDARTEQLNNLEKELARQTTSTGDSISSQVVAPQRQPAPQRKPSRSYAVPVAEDAQATKSRDAEEEEAAFWRENGVATASSKKSSNKTPRHAASGAQQTPKQALKLKEVDGETWETWDSPVAGQTPASAGTSAEQGRRSSNAPTPAAPPLKRRESIPWPTLNAFSPGQLKRTASQLMQEWEKSLTPSPMDSDGKRLESHAEDDQDLMSAVDQIRFNPGFSH